jgi:hypothetical protein
MRMLVPEARLLAGGARQARAALPPLSATLTLLALAMAASIAAGETAASAAVRILSPLFVPGWQAENVSSPCVLFDRKTGSYRMYYSGSATAQTNESVWDRWSTGLMTSQDALEWSPPDDYQPVVAPARFAQGEVLDRERLAASFDSAFAYRACVIADGSNYRMWYTGWDGSSEPTAPGLVRQIGFRIGYATSPDGNRWTKHAGAAGAGAVLGLGAQGEPDAQAAAHPSVLKEGARYRMWYECDDGKVSRICAATSASQSESNSPCVNIQAC